MAVPANAPQPWLPLRELSLQYLSTPQAARAGAAATVTVEARADGASATQLPELQLPPVDGATASGLVSRLRLSELLAGHRGRPALDTDGLVAAVVAFSQLAYELGDLLEAVDVNPLVVGQAGVVAVDVLVVPR